MGELRSRLTLGNIKNRPLGPDFSYGSPGQAKLLQKQKLSITASLDISRINSTYILVSLHERTTFSPNLGEYKKQAFRA